MSKLNVHVRTHTHGERPFVCKTCWKDFRVSGEWIVHVRRAHIGEKSHVCQTCGKRYIDSGQNAHTQVIMRRKYWNSNTIFVNLLLDTTTMEVKQRPGYEKKPPKFWT